MNRTYDYHIQMLDQVDLDPIVKTIQQRKEELKDKFFDT